MIVPITPRRVRFTCVEDERTCSCCYEKATITVRVEEDAAPGVVQRHATDGPVMRNGAVDAPDVRGYVLICPACLSSMLGALRRVAPHKPEDA